jgi:effector-binding domain-containing protein
MYARYSHCDETSCQVDVGYALTPSLVKEKKIQGDPKQNIEVSTVPGGKYAKMIHVGPYTKLKDTWKDFHEWFKKEGKKSDDRPGLNWEKYISDPCVTKEEELITEIWWRLNDNQ